MKLKLDEAKKKIIIGGYYAHYKHPGEKRYQIVDIGVWEKTEELCVMYKALDTGIVWIRTMENFLEEVDVGGMRVKRFTLI